MHTSVRILSRAEEDVKTIFAWIAERSPVGAQAWLMAFELAVTQLPRDPTAYGFAPETGLGEFELRQFLFRTRRGRTYRGVFIIQSDTIYILRIRGPGQAPLTQIEPIE